MKVKSPYMLFVTQLKNDKCIDIDANDKKQGLDKLKIIRSQVPSITHVDNTARVQSVSDESNPVFFRLLSRFYKLTQCPMLINTSFNVRGEPIVESPDDALACFMATGMDVLAIGSFVLLKGEQPDNLLDKLKTRKSAENQQAPAVELLPGDLRKFAISTGIAVSLIFGWFLPWLVDLKPDMTVVAGSALWIAWGLLFPATLRPVYKGWMRFGSMMGRFMTPLILSVIYYILITPFGLIIRLSGNDPLSRKMDSSVISYRVTSEKIEPGNLEKPF
jgi:carbamoyltransferase